MTNATGVLFLDDDDDLRDTFTDLVQTVFERRCVGCRSYEELVALGEQALGCAVAVLDINLGPNVPSGLDAYAWLRSRGFKGRIVFLTGHANSHPLVLEATRLGDADVVAKPISSAVLRSLVEMGPATDGASP
jgi:FixJ family two-component response regulator